MNKTGVWHPDTSLAVDDGCEERGRGSLASKQTVGEEVVRKTKAKIPRRRTPTVDVSAIMNVYPKRQVKESHSNASTPGSTYDTIECRTGPSFLECSSVVYHRSQGPTTTRLGWDFCGWKDKENLDAYRHEKTIGSHTSSGVMDRRDINTPADNFRPAIRASASRYSSSYGYRRRNDYEFKHLVNTHQYIEQYRQTCSYTTYMTSQKTSNDPEQQCEPEEVEQDPYNTMPLGVKSWYRGGDPYLREIVSRLGVRDVSREQQLLKSPKPTPPSIVKRNKNQTDLVVCANGRTNSPEDISLPTGENLIGNSSQNSPKSSRPVSRSIGVGSLELPTIAQTTHIRPPSQRTDNRNKNSSVISVTKYLQVTSHNRHTLTEEEGEEFEDGREDKELARVCDGASGSFDSLSNEILAQHFSSEKMAPNQRSNLNSNAPFQVPKPATLTVQQQLLYMDSSQREKLISNKAHSLGLISRDWSHMRRTLNRNSQPASSENNDDDTGYRYTLFMRSSKRQNQDTNSQRRPRIDQATGQIHHDTPPERKSPQPRPQREHRQQLPPSRPKTKAEDARPKTRAEDLKKLERLKSIYEPSSKRNPRRRNDPPTTRQPSRCESRATSRAQTRTGFRRQSSKPRVPSRYASTRPATRAATDGSFQRKVKGQLNVSEEQEGSTYWNELPIKPRHLTPKSRPVTGRSNIPGQATNTHRMTPQQKHVVQYHHTNKEEGYPRMLHKQNTTVVGTRC